MSEPRIYHAEDTETRKQRDRRRLRFAILFSAVFHILILLFGPIGGIPLLSSAAGPNNGDDTAASGELNVIAMFSAPPRIEMPPIQPRPIVEPFVPIPVSFVPDELPELPPITDLTSGFGTTEGDAPRESLGPGLPGATGRGAGGNAATGAARVVNPVPISILIPETGNALRGRDMEVRVFVNEQGRVVPDSTRLTPPTSNQQFNERMLENAATWRFRPAQQNGAPVAAWFSYVVQM